MKVAIVCGSPSSEMLAPFDDPEWEIWVLGNRIDRFRGKRVTKIFEIHNTLSEHKEPVKYAEFLAKIGLPLVVGEMFPVNGDHIKVFDYPASEALYGSLYLTSSPAYMISQAICEGVTHLGIYGVDLAITNHEYYWQRPCVEAWIGFAKGRGIEVVIPDVSPVGKAPYVEGRDWDGTRNNYKSGKFPFTQTEFERLAEIQNKKTQEIDAQIEALKTQANVYAGTSQAYLHLAQVARAVEAGNQIDSLSDTIRR